MTQTAHARIDLDALRSNFARVRTLAPASRVMAAVKSNAYGHGATRIARALHLADGFAVARLDEALALREAGVNTRLVHLSGVYDAASLCAAASAGVELVIHHSTQLELLDRASAKSGVRVWLKLDTGMHRLGFDPAEARGVLKRLRNCAAVREVVAVLSHLACADDADNPRTTVQCAEFERATVALGLERSLANSAGIVAWPQSHLDWVRPGIMLYGASPMVGREAAADALRPVMTFGAKLIAIKALRKGERVGYGASFECARDTVIGIAGAGYGDGYPRHAPSGTPVLVGNRRASLAGRVSMDMLAIDLGPASSARVGDFVTLWGEGLAIEEIARAAATIPYELTCGIGRRVSVEYLGESSHPAGSRSGHRKPER